MDPEDRVDRSLASLHLRGRATVGDRVRRLRLGALLAVQAGLATTLAWYVANDLLDNPQPVFAPAVAVGTIASSIGYRLRRTLYVIGGVTIGITVGDLLVVMVGSGHLQIGLIVGLSVLLAIMLTGEGAVLTQAGGSALVIAVLAPASTELAFPRFVDGLVGGAVGLFVSLILLPLHPIHRMKKAAGPPLGELATQLARVGDALAARDADSVKQALDRLRGVRLDDLESTLAGAAEVVRLSPIRWQHRSTLEGWRRDSKLMMRSLVQSRPLLVSLEAAIRHHEPLPDSLLDAVRHLSSAVRQVRDGFAPGARPANPAQRAALCAASCAERALESGLGKAGVSVAEQIKIVSGNTLRATGISKADNERLQQAVKGRPGALAP